jgi:hypothetical protein
MGYIVFSLIKDLSENVIFSTTYKGIPILFRVNKDKIPLDKFENLMKHQYSKQTVVLEKVEDLDLFKSSDYKLGFIDSEFILGDIGSDITSFKKV